MFIERKEQGAGKTFQWNIPNLLTVARIGLVPFQTYFLINRRFALALALYVIAVATDLLDGYLARKFSQRTWLGAALDPLADKLTILSIFFSLLFLRIIPLWFGCLVMLRDVLILFMVWVLVYTGKRVPWRAIPIGKLATFLQNATVVASIARYVFGMPEVLFQGLAIVTAGITVASGYGYFQLWKKIYSGSESKNIVVKEFQHGNSN